MRNLKRALALITAVLIAAGCSSSPPTPTAPEIEVPEFETWQEWADWRNDLNRSAEQEAAIAWLTDNDFEVHTEEDGCFNLFMSEEFEPSDTGEIPAEGLRAMEDCWDASSAAIPAFQTGELPLWYESLVSVYECITGLLYDIPPPPTFDDFVKSWYDPDVAHWNPTPPRNFEAVMQICPTPLVYLANPFAGR